MSVCRIFEVVVVGAGGVADGVSTPPPPPPPPLIDGYRYADRSCPGRVRLLFLFVFCASSLRTSFGLGADCCWCFSFSFVCFRLFFFCYWRRGAVSWVVTEFYRVVPRSTEFRWVIT